VKQFGKLVPAVIGLAAVAALAQTRPAPTPTFEVASVKLSKTGGMPGLHPEPARFAATNMTLKSLLMTAYSIREDQITGGPNWLDSDRYDIAAKCERISNLDDQKQMLRALLIDRFKLRIRQTSKNVPGFDLIVAKNGPKLRTAKEGEPSFRRFGLGRLAVQNAPMPTFARLLVELRFTPENYQPKPPDSDESKHEPAPPDPNGSSIFTALQEQLGLKLESKKGPAEILIIDHAEKPSEN